MWTGCNPGGIFALMNHLSSSMTKLHNELAKRVGYSAFIGQGLTRRRIVPAHPAHLETSSFRQPPLHPSCYFLFRMSDQHLELLAYLQIEVRAHL